MKTYILPLFIFFSLCFSSCEKEKTSDSSSEEDIELTVKYSNTVATQANQLIENEINQALAQDELIDVDAIVDSLELLDEVKSATATESGAGIVVELANGIYTNIIVARRDDERIWEDVNTEELARQDRVTIPGQKNQEPKSILEIPEGKDALILLPYQTVFNDYHDEWIDELWKLNYDVVLVQNESADLGYFRYDNLKDHDVIIISTHGLGNGMTRSGSPSTLLSTGELVTADALNALTAEERRSVGQVGVDGETYFAMSVPFLRVTQSGTFPKSWFYANACESSMIQAGATSLMRFLLDNGVGGYSGYTESINNGVARPATRELLNYLVEGKSLQEATNKTKQDKLLSIWAFLLRFRGGATCNVQLLQEETRIDENFYLASGITHFPYNRCRFNFWSRATYSDIGFVFSREVNFEGKFTDGVFRGSYEFEDDYHEINDSIEITIDLENKRITEFVVVGHEKENTSSLTSDLTWKVTSTENPLTTDGSITYFYVNDVEVDNHVDNVSFVYKWTDHIYETNGTNTLTSVDYDDDSKLEFQFWEEAE